MPTALALIWVSTRGRGGHFEGATCPSSYCCRRAAFSPTSIGPVFLNQDDSSEAYTNMQGPMQRRAASLLPPWPSVPSVVKLLFLGFVKTQAAGRRVLVSSFGFRV